VPPSLDTNTLFFWLVVAAIGVDLLRSLRVPGAAIRGVRISLAMVMVTALVARFVYPSHAGFIALFAWAVFALAPALVARTATQQAHRGEFARARRLTRILRVLRPFERWRDLSDYYRALELERRGDSGAAEGIFEKLRSGGGPFAFNATVEWYTARGEWAKLRLFIEQQRATGKPDPMLTPTWLRTLGELGEPATMLEAAEQASSELRAPIQSRLLDHCRLFVFAFSGLPGRVEQVLSGPLRWLDPVVAEVWRATAELCDGQIDRGRSRLVRCLTVADPRARRAIYRRLDHPPPVAVELLNGAARARLARVEREWDWARRYSPDHVEPRRIWTTWALSALLVLVFIVEMVHGSSMDPETLFALGALDSASAIAGDWWRIITAQLLHYGPLHLVANVGALLLLGGFVERRLGPARYLLVYFAAGTLALSSFVALVALGLRPHAVLLGASANVMGVVGAMAAILVRGLWTEGARVAARPLVTIVLIVLGQAALDLTVKGLSFIGHALGAVTGFVVAGLLLRLRVRVLAIVFSIGLIVSAALESWSASRAAEGQPDSPDPTSSGAR
jgi:membrane associated rhomboid family serine protease